MKVIFKEKFTKYEKYLSPLALFSGFIIDNLTLRRIDLWVENLIIVFYLLLALVSIFVLNFSHAGFFKHKFFKNTDLVFSLILQFVFGALFSVFFVFYFRSASFISSWLFLLFLGSLLIGNELFRNKYKQLAFQSSVFFIALFSYSVILIPLLIRKINSYTFIFSGFFSLALMLIILYLLYKFFPKRFFLNKNTILFNIAIIYFIFNLFYFLNIIPPIPLSLKESEIAHSLERVNGSYIVQYEKSSFLQFGKSKNTFQWKEGTPVYFYTSIFAPTKININIYHKWYLYDTNVKKWILKSTLSYPIFGGRDDGYRGYSYKYSVEAGKWKVETTNEKGQILGSRKFNIKKVEELSDFENDIW